MVGFGTWKVNDTIRLACKDAALREIHDSLQSPGAREDEHVPGGVRRWVARDNQPELCHQVGDAPEAAGQAARAEIKQLIGYALQHSP